MSGPRNSPFDIIRTWATPEFEQSLRPKGSLVPSRPPHILRTSQELPGLFVERARIESPFQVELPLARKELTLSRLAGEVSVCVIQRLLGQDRSVPISSSSLSTEATELGTRPHAPGEARYLAEDKAFQVFSGCKQLLLVAGLGLEALANATPLLQALVDSLGGCSDPSSRRHSAASVPAEQLESFPPYYIPSMIRISKHNSKLCPYENPPALASPSANAQAC